MGEKTETEKALRETILHGRHYAIKAIIQKALSEGFTPEALMNNTMIPVMDVVGDQFARGEIYLPEMMIAARAMTTGLDFIRPMIASVEVSNRGKVVIGTVKGDIHDIGKNIVITSLECGGYEVVDLGIDRAPELFVDAIHTYHPQFALMSALLTTTMSMMDMTIKAIQRAGLREKVKIGVGGAPITAGFAERIGADFYGKNARAAVTNCNALRQ